MKGDFSRLTFDRKKHYSGVLMQQGRVLLDADWNEQQAINRDRTETETADVIGPSGSPQVGGVKILTRSFARGVSVVRDEKANTLKGWVVGDKAAILYWDGTAFTFQAAPEGVTATLRSVYFVDEKNGWAVGDKGVILHTKDGGAQWSKQLSKTTGDLRSVYFIKLEREFLGCAVGEKGMLLYSNNSGKNWVRQDTKTKENLNALHILPLNKEKGFKLFVVGDQRTIREYLWDTNKNQLASVEVVVQNDTNAKPDLFSVNSLSIGDAERAYAVGETGAVFAKSGQSWLRQASGVAMALKAVLVILKPDGGSDNIPCVWAAIGENGTVLTTDTMEHWKVYHTRLPEKVIAANFIDANRDKTQAETVVLGSEGGVYGQGVNGWLRITRLIDSLAASSGRIYVDGILCKFDDDTPLPLPSTAGKHLVYLDVWQRHITALQDPDIRERALGGPDTCTRVQTISQVKYLPLVRSGVIQEIEAMRASARELAVKLKEALIRRAEAEDADVLNQATAQMLKMADMTDEELLTHLYSDPRKIGRFVEMQKQRLSPAALEKVQVQLDAWEKLQTGIVQALGSAAASSPWDKLTNPGSCALKADVKQDASEKTPCSIGASGGYQGLENQLYRVEIHDGSDDTTGPTFKWSRNNGSVIFPFEILSINDNKTIINLTTQDLGSYYPVAKEEWVGAWVEVINDDLELEGKPGILLQIADVPSDTQMILDGALDTTVWSNKAKHPLIRRWDQRDGVGKTGAVPVKEGEWLDLESGVRIWFEKDGMYRTGDYWVIPARTETGNVEWPQSGDAPVAQAPRGIRHHYAQLALLTAYATGKNRMILTEFHDCRAVFPPLANDALHVVGINWLNDSYVLYNESFEENLLGVGFQIILDDAPDSWTVNPSTMTVTLELPTGLSTVVSGDITVKGNVISWRIVPQIKKAPTNTNYPNVGLTEMPDISGMIIVTEVPHRVRIALKGRLIWRTCCDRRIYLDGQVFGRPRYELDQNGDTVARCGLVLPSGAGDRASDFESWFYIMLPAQKSGPTKAATAAETKNAPGKGKRRGN